MKKIFAAVLMMGSVALAVSAGGAVAESTTKQEQETRLTSIAKNCEKIRENLVDVQHNDSRARVYLGRYYETILTKLITPLNVWLVGKNKSNAGLIENQNSFARVRGDFVSDYIEYQKGLEELVAVNCETEPAKFDERLTAVRKARAKVAGEVTKLRKLMDEQIKLVEGIKGALR